MSTNRTFKLENGITIPSIGFGTWKSSPEDTYSSVKKALEIGYRHVDTAWVKLCLSYTNCEGANTYIRFMGMNLK